MRTETKPRPPRAARYKVRLKVGRHCQDEPDPDNPGGRIEVNYFQGDVFYSQNNLAGRWPEKFERADDYQNLTGNDQGDLDSLQRLRDELNQKIAGLRAGGEGGRFGTHDGRPLGGDVEIGSTEELEAELLRAEQNPVKAQLLVEGKKISTHGEGGTDSFQDKLADNRAVEQSSPFKGNVPIAAKPMAADPKAKLEALERLGANDLRRLCQNNLGADGKPAPIAFPANASKADLAKLLSGQ